MASPPSQDRPRHWPCHCGPCPRLGWTRWRTTGRHSVTAAGPACRAEGPYGWSSARSMTCRLRHPCGRPTLATFPATVAGPVQYGLWLAALVAYLRYAQHLPVTRLARLLRELYGVALSTGPVENLCRRVARHNRARLARLRRRVPGHPGGLPARDRPVAGRRHDLAACALQRRRHLVPSPTYAA